MVNRLTSRLSNRGFQVVALSGELSQAERTHALQAMRDGRAQVCVATDVAARGIDLPKLDLVVHAELPSNHETLLHRSGRTGRAGRKGVSALVVTPKSRKKAQRIVGMAKLKVDWSDAPSADAVKAREEDRMFADSDWNLAVGEGEKATVEKLTNGFSAEQLAAAYLRLYRSIRSAPEELSDVNVKPAPRQEFGPSVWFAISGGRDANAEPRRLLPMICKAADLTKDDIGAIRIQKTESYVQIRQASVPAFLTAVGPEMVLEKTAKLRQLDEAPVLERKDSAFAKPMGKPRRNDRDKPASKAGKWDPADISTEKTKPRKTKPDSKRKGGFEQPKGKPTGEVKKPKIKSKKDARHSATEPAQKSAGGDAPLRRAKLAGGKPKGPTPPKGKPSSKKNRARALEAKGKKNAAAKDRKRTKD